MHQVTVPAWLPGALMACTPMQMNAIVQVFQKTEAEDAGITFNDTTNSTDAGVTDANVTDANIAEVSNGPVGSMTTDNINANAAMYNGDNNANATVFDNNDSDTLVIPTHVPINQGNRKQRRQRIRRDATTVGPKRPLNSWMAFRKYYSKALTPMTQKAISKILTAWWKEDPFEAKWVVLAKAYSILRANRRMNEAPLDSFLALCAPMLMILPPSEYQLSMGWTLSAPGPGSAVATPTAVRVTEPSFNTGAGMFGLAVNMGINELVEFCISRGFPRGATNPLPNNNFAGQVAMTVNPVMTTIPGPEALSETVNPAAIGNGDVQSATANPTFANTVAHFNLNPKLDFTQDTQLALSPSFMSDEAFLAALTGAVADPAGVFEDPSFSFFDDNYSHPWLSYGMEGHELIFPHLEDSVSNMLDI